MIDKAQEMPPANTLSGSRKAKPVAGRTGKADPKKPVNSASSSNRKPAARKGSVASMAQSTLKKSTKTDQALALLRRPAGCTLAELMKATKWQQHSVRGFLSGTVKKRLGLTLTSEAADKGRRYRVSGPSRSK